MNNKTKWMVQSALIAAMYVVLTQIASVLGLSSGVIQIRFSEALNVVACFSSAAVPGLFIGCVLANILSGAVLWDVIFGSIATLIGVLGVYFLRSKRILALFCPVISNAIIIPFILRYAYGFPGVMIYFIVTVAIGEIISCGIIGFLLGRVLDNHKSLLFK